MWEICSGLVCCYISESVLSGGQYSIFLGSTWGGGNILYSSVQHGGGAIFYIPQVIMGWGQYSIFFGSIWGGGNILYSTGQHGVGFNILYSPGQYGEEPHPETLTPEW